MKCKECQNTNLQCIDCDTLIDGGLLQRQLKYPRKIVLTTPESESYPAELFLISPVGFGIKGDIPPREYYIAEVMEHLQIKLKMIAVRGKDGWHGFDIVEVIRENNISPRLNNEEYQALTMSSEQMVEQVTQLLPENIKEIVEQRLKTEIEKANIINSLQVSKAFKFQRGNLKTISNNLSHLNISNGELIALGNKCCRENAPSREIIMAENDTMYDIHGIPFDFQSAGLLVLDVTEIVQKERELKKKEKQIYRDVIEAVTGGKLLLVERTEISSYLAIGQAALNIDLNNPQDLEAIRSRIETILNKSGANPKDTFMCLVSVSEALTNALKHASGGTCRINLLPTGIRVIIADRGSGINFRDLPKATLMSSFSTKKSLGYGFTIMLKYLDKVILATDPQGTILILEKTNMFEEK